jgi:outer membrane lipoprotein-sorting protein
MMKTLLTLAFGVILSVSAMSAVTIDEIVKNHLEARGGEKALKALKTMKIQATMQSMGGEMKATQFYKDGKKIRIDIEFQGMTITQAYDGATAWGLNPMGGGTAEKASPEQSQSMAQQANFAGDLVNHKDLGLTLELAGTEDLDGMTAYKIKVTDKAGESWNTYIDAITWLAVRTDRTTEMMGQTFEIEVYYSNYKDIAGVQCPTQIDMKAGGQDMMAMTWDKIEPNVEIPDSVFAFPGE